jgi:hypothetical protein
MKPAERLALRRQILVGRSTQLRLQMRADGARLERGVAQGLSLGRVALGTLGLIGTFSALRRSRPGRSRWRLLASAWRLLPVAWGVWRSAQAARPADPRPDRL